MKETATMATLNLSISWKGETGFTRKSKLLGYESVEDARRQLKKRWSDKAFYDVAGGFAYEEPFSCKGETGVQVFTITAKGSARRTSNANSVRN